MTNGKSYNRARTVKLDLDEDATLQKHCDMLGIEASTFIRQAINEKLTSGNVSNVAGKNKILYDSEKNVFSWFVELDDGREVEVLRNLSVEFIQNLKDNMQFELKKQEELLGKKKKASVAVPKGLVR